MWRYLLRQAPLAARTSLKRTRPGSRIMIRSLVESRQFSSQPQPPPPPPIHGYRELQQLTTHMLHPRTTPLGTMTAAQWDKALLTMLHWFQDDKHVLEGSESTEESVKVTGLAAKSVDLLLCRLHNEHDTNSVASRQRADELAQWTLAVMGVWIQVGRDFPSSTMAAERSTEWWNKIVQWKRERGQGDLPLNEFTGLVQVWLALETPDGTEKAAELLLSDTIALYLAQDDQSIIPCFHQTLVQSIQFVDTCGGLSALLVERMEELALEPGWEDIQPNEEEIQLQLDTLLKGQITPENKKLLSSFETLVLRERMLQLIQEANENDKNTVDEIVERWNAIEPDETSATDLSHALLGYYLRVQDARQATSLLVKLDQMNAEFDEKSKLFEQLFHLWSTSDESDAAWRCGEILPRLEELVSREGGAVDPFVYTVSARLWLESSDIRGATKALELVARVEQMNASLLQICLDACLQGSSVSNERVAQIMEQARGHWHDLDGETQSKMTESMAQVVAKRKSTPMAIELTRFLITEGAVIPTTVCEKLISAFAAQQSGTNHDVLVLMELLEKYGAQLSLDCYRSALTSLALAGVGGTPEMILETKNVLSRLGDGIGAGKLSASSEELGETLAAFLDSIPDEHEGQAVMEILEVAFEKLHQAPAFHIGTVTALIGKTTPSMVSKILDRLWENYESGTSDFVPNADFYMDTLKALQKEGDCTLVTRNMLVADLIRRYQANGTPECKPLDTMFHVALPSSGNSSVKTIEQTVALLYKMVDLQVEFTDVDAFHRTINLLLEGPKTPLYRQVMEVQEAMQAAGVAVDAHTMHLVLRACGHAHGIDRDKAVTNAVASFYEIRLAEKVDQRTYTIYTETLGNLLSWKDPRLFSLVQKSFLMCCNDGLFSKRIRENFQRLVTPRLWNRLYSHQLQEGEKEPSVWSRNVETSS